MCELLFSLLLMLTLLNKFPPAIQAFILQLTSVLLLVLALKITSLSPPPLLFALCCGLLASLMSYGLGLARWWWLIQFFFAPAVVVMLSIELPPSVFLGAFLLFVLVYWSTFRSQVPLYLSSHKVWAVLASVLPRASAEQPLRFIDLGSGLGGVLTYLARAQANGHYVGVETAPLPVLLSWLRIKLGRYANCRVMWGSMWDCDLGEYDVVFAYLSPVPMAQLWHKARAEMRPGSLFISSTFVVLDHPPQRTVQVDDLHRATLYIWEM